MKKTTTRRLRNTGLIGGLAGALMLGPAFVAPAINASAPAKTASISIPVDGAEAATRYPLCNPSGIPIKWGNCYSYHRYGWEKGPTTYANGKSYTTWYSLRVRYLSGISLGIERDGDWTKRLTSSGRPTF